MDWVAVQMTVMTAPYGLVMTWRSGNTTAAHKQQQTTSIGHGTGRCVPPNA